MDLFEECISHVEKCLKDAEMDRKNIHDVVLVGGSSRIPKVQQLLQGFFDGKELCKNIHPESLAYGAAIQAAIFSGLSADDIRDLVLWDVTPLSLGVEVLDNYTSVVVPRNTTVSTRKKQVFTTHSDNQTCMPFRAYEGERPKSQDNILLGEFTLFGISHAPRCVPQIKGCFDIDVNRILTVTAEDKATGNANGITISNVKGMLSQTEILRMLEQAEKLKLEDEEHNMIFQSKNSLEDYVYDARAVTRILTSKLKGILFLEYFGP
ncbi:heat shock 70 kDa protein 4-like [Henckelia pumila]|uniref:heat shock 70 kDa protein 4-like n=1 Tax=Henckelia pumila TaxID=405737 RepID=UPI003C6DE395